MFSDRLDFCEIAQSIREEDRYDSARLSKWCTRCPAACAYFYESSKDMRPIANVFMRACYDGRNYSFEDGTDVRGFLFDR